jgi:hypothetical protein
MARYSQGIDGPFSGKIANIVGVINKKTAYIRSKARITKPSRSPKQTAQRNKFATAINLVIPLLPVIRQGWKLHAIRQTAFNAATSHTIKNAVIGEYPNYQIDHTKVLISKGNLRPIQNPEITVNETSITLTWQDNSPKHNANANPTDKLLIALINPSKNQSKTLQNKATRADKQLTINLKHWKNDTIHAYIGLISDDERQVATSTPICNIQISREGINSITQRISIKKKKMKAEPKLNYPAIKVQGLKEKNEIL